MRIEQTDYSSIECAGLEAIVEEKLSIHEFIAVGCHRGVRRSLAAIHVLKAMRFQLQIVST